MPKMTLTTKTILAVTLMLAGAGSALAHSNEARQDEQAQAIEQGRRDGSITWTEGRQLRKDQREIAEVKASFEADGYLSRQEKRVLHKMQTEADARIDAEANDSRPRASFLPRFGR
jgi:outer membrane lipopolysaccharide assembly protein LptE/RlpB